MEVGNILFQDLLGVKEHQGDKVTLWDVSILPAAGGILIRSTPGPEQNPSRVDAHLQQGQAQVGASGPALSPCRWILHRSDQSSQQLGCVCRKQSPTSSNIWARQEVPINRGWVTKNRHGETKCSL